MQDNKKEITQLPVNFYCSIIQGNCENKKCCECADYLKLESVYEDDSKNID